ncbi:hypothetical protein Tco_0519739 [Tanacetum coccineum]
MVWGIVLETLVVRLAGRLYGGHGAGEWDVIVVRWGMMYNGVLGKRVLVYCTFGRRRSRFSWAVRDGGKGVWDERDAGLGRVWRGILILQRQWDESGAFGLLAMLFGYLRGLANRWVIIMHWTKPWAVYAVVLVSCLTAAVDVSRIEEIRFMLAPDRPRRGIHLHSWEITWNKKLRPGFSTDFRDAF